MGIAYEWQPLQQRPTNRFRGSSKFKAKWSDTMDLLDRELSHLGVRRAVLQVDADRSQFRLDGMLRADARTQSPAIAISFRSKGKDLTFPCDTYSDWRDNVRAIALALEALRKIDRYGVTSRGEQYTGWAALPPPGSHEFTSRRDAMAFLEGLLGGEFVQANQIETILRKAEFTTHPDKGGRACDFQLVQAARKFLLGSES
jgi:hypothetical protein